jgi:MFS family permease
MFWLGVPLVLLAAGLMFAMLPRAGHTGKVQYGMALRSLAHFWRTEPALRNSTLVQAGIFASFSTFWAVLALHLQEPAFDLGPGVAGLFGVVGAVGVLAAPLAGRLADRLGAQTVVTMGACLTLLAWVLFALSDHLIGLIVGVIVLDFGVQSAMVSNQHVIYALRPDARNRLNTLYMTGIFTGGAIGSTGAMTSWEVAGWNGVCAFAIAAVALSMVVMIVRHTTRKT